MKINKKKLERLEQEAFLRAANEEYDCYKHNAQGKDDLAEEMGEWDVTLQDGLENEPVN